MRLHHLSATAFGPFASQVDIDFDDLNAAGLFLLCGPTGSGKSSVLDAVCFALFGSVAGERNLAKQFKSDHADVATRPRVVLECSIGARRVRITRTPSWLRPKKRGQGQIMEQPSVVLQVAADVSRAVTESSAAEPDWSTLTTRLDEAGDLLTSWLGVNLPQFLQVAMLPQGDFQRFLGASASERLKLLEKLFRTETYLRVEQSLIEQRRAAQKDVDDAMRVIDTAVAKVETAAGVNLANDDPIQCLDGSLELRLTTLLVTLGESARAAESAAQCAQARAEQAEAELTRGRVTADLQKSGTDAQILLSDLREQQATIDAQRLAVEAAVRAAPVVPLLRLADQSRTTLARADQRVEKELRLVAAHLPGAADLAAATQAHRESVGARAIAETLVQQQRSLTKLHEQVATTSSQIAALESQRATAAGVLALIPARQHHLNSQIDALAADLADPVECQRRVEELCTLRDFARERDDASEQFRLLAVAVADAKAEEAAAREHWLSAKEARIAGMAAELAVSLAVGSQCPVCGSAEHPHIAMKDSRHVDAAAEDAALRARDNAASAAQTLVEEQRTLGRHIDDLQTRCARRSTGDVDRELRDARARLEHATETSERLSVLRAKAESVAEESTRLQAKVDRVSNEITLAQATLAAPRAQIDRVSQELSTLLAGHQARDAEEFLRELQQRSDALWALIEALTERNSAQVRQRENADALITTLARQGFESVDAVTAAALTDAQIAAHQREIREYDEAWRGVQQTLARPEVAASLAMPEIDVLDLQLAKSAAEQALLRDHNAWQVSQQRHAQVSALVCDLLPLLRALKPLQERAAMIAGLAQLAEGKGEENPKRISLSTYVLAQRLRQVVAAANERLAPMSDHRFHLEHTEERKGREQGGLALRIIDDWTQSRREVGTLSGGESFIVSLALALGLADVISHEAGGIEIGTLFVDEGFGSLDSSALEQVLDVLDQLRTGGRVVGVVSHVADMRERITARVEVTKTLTGSKVAVLAGD